MNKYFFILGRNPTLSLAEIIFVLDKNQIVYTIDKVSQEVAIISSENQLDVFLFMRTLGGTIKIGLILDAVGLEDDEIKFQEVISSENLLDKYFSRKETKIHFGVSVYNANGDVECFDFLSRQLKDICVSIKRNLREKEKKAGFVRIKERFLSSVSVVKNQLLDKGAEIVFLLTKEKILVGKTLIVQEFGSFSFRDYGRPARDKRSGIIPPKLARIMINLAKIDKNNTILDPFCGSGTILQEAIMLGYKNILGSDISSKAILDTNRNIEWLFQNFRQLEKSSYNIRTLVADVQMINKYFQKDTIDAIITEPYLGPPLFKKPNLPTIQKNIFEVSKLYLESFLQFSKIVKFGGKVVIIFPAFEENKKTYFVEILEKIRLLGFAQQEFFRESLKDHSGIYLTSRKTILYGGKEQFIKREILSFQKIK